MVTELARGRGVATTGKNALFAFLLPPAEIVKQFP